jgi:hypothetical protein
MKINMSDCLQLAAVFLQLENALALLCGRQEDLNEEELKEAQKDKELLLRCANLVVNEIASEYVHLNAFQTFRTENGHIPYSLFEKQPADITAVHKEGSCCRFKLYPCEIITESGTVDVFYRYLPQNKAADGVLDFEEGKINQRIIAYGTAAEYCIIKGMYEEGVVWDKRYKDSLSCALKISKPITLAARKWA